jgi:hypothetical protein
MQQQQQQQQIHPSSLMALLHQQCPSTPTTPTDSTSSRQRQWLNSQQQQAAAALLLTDPTSLERAARCHRIAAREFLSSERPTNFDVCFFFQRFTRRLFRGVGLCLQGCMPTLSTLARYFQSFLYLNMPGRYNIRCGILPQLKEGSNMFS